MCCNFNYEKEDTFFYNNGKFLNYKNSEKNVAPDSEDILEPIFLKNLCMLWQKLFTGSFCNGRGHIQENYSTDALGFDFGIDLPTRDTEHTGRSECQESVCTSKITKFKNYLGQNWTLFYVYCTIDLHDLIFFLFLSYLYHMEWQK